MAFMNVFVPAADRAEAAWRPSRVEETRPAHESRPLTPMQTLAVAWWLIQGLALGAVGGLVVSLLVIAAALAIR